MLLAAEAALESHGGARGTGAPGRGGGGPWKTEGRAVRQRGAGGRVARRGRLSPPQRCSAPPSRAVRGGLQPHGCWCGLEDGAAGALTTAAQRRPAEPAPVPPDGQPAVPVSAHQQGRPSTPTAPVVHSPVVRKNALQIEVTAVPAKAAALVRRVVAPTLGAAVVRAAFGHVSPTAAACKGAG